jgi:Domain of unknown function (DUF5655)
MLYSEIDHLESRSSAVNAMYKMLIREVQKFGPVKIEPKKTSIHLVNRFAFAGVYTRNEYINLEFHLSHKLIGSRIAKMEKASANRFHITVRISLLKEIDKELLSWLKEAFELKK